MTDAYIYVIDKDLTLAAAAGLAARVRQQATTAVGEWRAISRYNQRMVKEWKTLETQARESREDTGVRPTKNSNISDGSRRTGGAFSNFMSPACGSAFSLVQCNLKRTGKAES